jgi:hypothetical protein
VRKIVAIVMAGAMGIGVVGFTIPSSASPKTRANTESSWTQWLAQEHPLYNAVHANRGVAMNMLNNGSNAQITAALTAEINVDVGFGSADDSPSAQINRNMLLYSRADAKFAALAIVCVNTSTPCSASTSAGNAAVLYWNLVMNEINAAMP